jgi:speckle-type POZ protein
MPIPTTISTCTPETEQGKHVFRIVGYSQQRGLRGVFITSAVFTVGGHGWVVSLCPDTTSQGFNADFVVVSLEFKGTGKVLASFELKLVEQCTGASFLVHKEAPMMFCPVSHRESVLVKKRSVFESPNYLRDGMRRHCHRATVN